MHDAMKAAHAFLAKSIDLGASRAASGGAPKIPDSVVQTVSEAAANYVPTIGTSVAKIAVEAIKSITRRAGT